LKYQQKILLEVRAKLDVKTLVASTRTLVNVNFVLIVRQTVFVLFNFELNCAVRSPERSIMLTVLLPPLGKYEKVD
jgi:hypothetical protein